jgi:hypothetical protein
MSKSSRTYFSAALWGFHFPNYWPDVEIGGLKAGWIKGRCGGMAALSLDYYFAGIQTPTHMAPDAPGSNGTGDFGASEVPADGTPLGDLINKRFLGVVGADLNTWLSIYANQLINTPLADIAELVVDPELALATWIVSNPNTTPQALSRDAIPRIMQSIDAGNPVMIALIKPLGDVSNSHYVVVTAYVEDTANNQVTFYMYDNRYEDQPTTLVLSTTNPGTATLIDPLNNTESYEGIFVAQYQAGPIQYFDLGMETDVVLGNTTVIPGPPQTVTVTLPGGRTETKTVPTWRCELDPGQPIVAGFTIKNFGAYPAHFAGLQITVSSPGQYTTVGTFAGLQQPQVLPVGGTMTLVGQAVPGTASLPPGYPYTVSAQFLDLARTNKNPQNWVHTGLPVTGANGNANHIWLEIAAPVARTQATAA